MKQFQKQYESLKIEDYLKQLVKLNLLMKKYFVYIDDIDRLKHDQRVIREFDKSINMLEKMENKIKMFYNKVKSYK